VQLDDAVPANPPAGTSPLASATTQRKASPLPPPKATVDATAGVAESKVAQQQVVNPHYLGNKVPPAADPQTEEFILDLSDAPSQPSPQSSPAIPAHQSVDAIPADALSRINAPFPQQHIPVQAQMPANMSTAGASLFDDILDGI
jgi:hypothetical protein